MVKSKKQKQNKKKPVRYCCENPPLMLHATQHDGTGGKKTSAVMLWVECNECSPCLEMLVVLLNCNPLTVTSHPSNNDSSRLCSACIKKKFFFKKNPTLIIIL